MTVVINRIGRMPRRSRNLRGILDYAREKHVTHVRMYMDGEQPKLHVRFSDDATCTTDFASHTVLRDWVKSRISWRPDEVLDELPS